MIHLYTNSEKIHSAVKMALPVKIERHKVTAQNYPGNVDAVVTLDPLRRDTLLFAAAHGTAFVFVLPEAAEALEAWCAVGGLATLAGNDIQKIKAPRQAPGQEVLFK